MEKLQVGGLWHGKAGWIYSGLTVLQTKTGSANGRQEETSCFLHSCGEPTLPCFPPLKGKLQVLNLKPWYRYFNGVIFGRYTMFGTEDEVGGVMWMRRLSVSTYHGQW